MKVSLFITCLVDQMYPQVGEAMVKLLRRLRVQVAFNAAQTCCGQPAFNAGYRTEARQVAVKLLEVFEEELKTADYIVAPSGSCVTMVRKFYRELFAAEPSVRARAERVGERVYELSDFIFNVLKVEDVGAKFRGRITYHDSCHLLRELGVADAPRKLIGAIEGAELIEMEGADVCCGFGGTFAVNYPEISTAIVADKARHIEATGADAVLACDASCVMQMAGMLKRNNSQVRCLHLAEMLCVQGA